MHVCLHIYTLRMQAFLIMVTSLKFLSRNTGKNTHSLLQALRAKNLVQRWKTEYFDKEKGFRA